MSWPSSSGYGADSFGTGRSRVDHAGGDRRIAIRSGHGVLVEGTDSLSNHYYGRVDIHALDGLDVTRSNHTALRLSAAILTSTPDPCPDELGPPWPELGTFPGAFSGTGHHGHPHLAWRAVGAP